jgi:hypothetical protein
MRWTPYIVTTVAASLAIFAVISAMPVLSGDLSGTVSDWTKGLGLAPWPSCASGPSTRRVCHMAEQ